MTTLVEGRFNPPEYGPWPVNISMREVIVLLGWHIAEHGVLVQFSRKPRLVANSAIPPMSLAQDGLRGTGHITSDGVVSISVHSLMCRSS